MERIADAEAADEIAKHSKKLSQAGSQMGSEVTLEDDDDYDNFVS